MRRALFIKLLVSGPFGWWLVRLLKERSQERRYLLNRFFVAGFKYYEGPSEITTIAEGESLRLKAESDNPFDWFAVEILRGESKMGYVPQTDNKHISRLLRQDVKLTCKVEKANPVEDPWKMLRVEVYI